MKKLKYLLTVLTLFLVLASYSQEALKVEFVKQDNQYLKTLNDGKKDCVFYIEGIKSQEQAKSLENYIRGYRGVEQFNLTKEQNGRYKAAGTFYSFANAEYFKYLFNLINVKKIFINNQWINVEQLNTL